jgi:hypothetical protein
MLRIVVPQAEMRINGSTNGGYRTAVALYYFLNQVEG